ncbi:hypothetical protein H8959_000216 [Pygathrix nigripes]
MTRVTASFNQSPQNSGCCRGEAVSASPGRIFRSSWKPGGEVFFLSYVGQATLSVRSIDDSESELRGEK